MICTPIVPFESSPQSLVDPKDPTPAEAVNMTPSLVVSAAKNEAKPGDIPAQFTKVLGKGELCVVIYYCLVHECQ